MRNRHIWVILLVLATGIYFLFLVHHLLSLHQEEPAALRPAEYYTGPSASFPKSTFRPSTAASSHASGAAMPPVVTGPVGTMTLHTGSSHRVHSVGGTLSPMTAPTVLHHSQRADNSATTIPMVMFSTSPMLAVNNRYVSVPSSDGGPARVVQRGARKLPEFPDDPGYGPQFPNEPGEGVDTPIGDLPLIFMLFALMGYMAYRKTHRVC